MRERERERLHRQAITFGRKVLSSLKRVESERAVEALNTKGRLQTVISMTDNC